MKSNSSAEMRQVGTVVAPTFGGQTLPNHGQWSEDIRRSDTISDTIRVYRLSHRPVND